MKHNVKKYLPYWKDQIKRQIELSKKWRMDAYREAGTIAQMLHQRYGVRVVYLIGSVARGDVYFYEKPDIDLAISGLKDRYFFKALSTIESKSNYHVDLIPLEDANDRIKEAVKREGVLLYGSR